ncbi:ABC transporter substrate-binding protein [Plastoroseomonas hellenica]|uniref:ABC transporter substrate-binding protein n=1 Tax=Plastoroseomonas hellenica TaxID=2687306 RepID=UPI001BA822AF|nr:ABC transporter substrate-binding protein [Plastoroseomonas hellenica]MBR0645726.1 ABC transporter substrate-binding protein [Plastoroseomonas hellenica]
MTTRRLSLLGAGFALLAALAAPPARAQETVLRVGMTAGDIPLTAGIPDQGFEGWRFVGYNLYDALVLWDLSRGDVAADIKPGLATSWAIDPNNNRRWIFQLRRDVRFHDGSPMTAADIVWNFERFTREGAPQFNPRQFAFARAYLGNYEGIEAVDELTVAITTKQPDSLLPYNMSFLMMVSPRRSAEVNNDADAFARNPSGTGPYRFARMVPGERLELVRNPDYWDRDRVPKHDRLVLLPMPEASTRTAALLSGQVDWIEAPAPDAIPRLRSARMQIVSNSYPHNWAYQLNFVDGPFADLRVRRAANHALNRADFVEMLGGMALPGFANLTPSTPYYGNPRRYEYDPARARALLQEAGCLPCRVTFAISTSGSGQMQPLPMNELVKAQLEAAGFQVTLQTMDWNALLQVGREGRGRHPTVNGINISRSLQDPFNGMFRFVWSAQAAPAGSNWGHYRSPEMDALVNQALATFDPAERLRILTQIHEKMSEDAVMLWVVHDLNPRAMSPRVRGFTQAQSWFQDLTPITIAPR